MALYHSRKNENAKKEEENKKTSSLPDALEEQEENNSSKNKSNTENNMPSTGLSFVGKVGKGLGSALVNKGANSLSKIPNIKNAEKGGNPDNNLLDINNNNNNYSSNVDSNSNSNTENSGQKQNPEKSNETQSTSSPNQTVDNNKKNAEQGEKEQKESTGLKDTIANKKEDKSNKSSKTIISYLMHHKVAAKVIIFLLPLLIFIVILIVFISIITSFFTNFADAFGISSETGFTTGGLEYEAQSEESKAFYKRVNELKEEYAENYISIDPLKVVSTFHIINSYNKNVDYDYMTKERINDIILAMLEHEEETDTYYYSEEKFRTELKDSIFKYYIPKSTEEEREEYVEQVFEYISLYYNLVDYTPNTCSDNASCIYNIKGFYIKGKGNINKNININNIKVRLMQSGFNYGGTFGLPMPNEELVDFEKYILGVTYGEIEGYPDEALKAQMVAARSYILARSTDMGGWRKWQQEGETTIIPVAASTQDQVYCDPDKGCSSNDNQNQQIYSGVGIPGIKVYKNSIPQNAKIRSLANETVGEVLVNSQGYIVYSDYIDTEQKQFKRLAEGGMNYKQILLTVYNSARKNYGATDIVKMNCNNTCASGDYASWKQVRGPWVSVPIGKSGKTISQIGCAATSLAIQVARSGVTTNIEGELNPGSFVEYLNSHNGFDSEGRIHWEAITRAAPNFKYMGEKTVLGYTREQKYNELVNLLNRGYYVVAEVKGNTGQHWVAVESAQNGTITMMDPASNNTNMWSGKYSWENTSRYVYYAVR